MFVIELIYRADLAAIDAHMAAHVKFLKKYYKAGEAIVQEDPFHAHQLADFRIIEFRASQSAEMLRELSLH